MGKFCRLVLLFLSVALPAGNAIADGPYITAIKHQRWAMAKVAVKGDPILTNYAEWRALKDTSNEVSFERIENFIRAHPDWPDMPLLRQRAEKILFIEKRRAQSAEWFAKYPPVSAYGKLALLRISKNIDAAQVKEAWINGDFDSPDEWLILAEFNHYITNADHIARVERLLMDDKATVAERQLLRLDDAHERLFRGRIALIRMDRDVARKVDAIPASLRGDHGLLADRVRWRDRKNMKDDALALLKDMSQQSPYANKLWPLRAWFVREYMDERRYAAALDLLERSGKLEGAAMADSLWLKGWLYLEHSESPGKSYDNFRKMYESVNYPVSRSRAAYWAARAAEKLGRKEEAEQYYSKAAVYPTVFYGQLAQQHLHPGQPLRLPEQPATNNALVEKYSQHELMQTTKRLTAIGEHSMADELISHMGDSADTPEQLAALVKACAKQQLPLAQVRAIKAALKQNVMLVKEGWPVLRTKVDIPIELPLAFAISRQESEFNPQAVSSAGARGLMQLLPATAKRIAQQNSLPYHPDRLNDPDYNIKVGSSYIGRLINGFRGSYILAIAGYNAGPARSEQWIDAYGRPGRTVTQTINWMETIPYAETRNYVQRVLENLQVYRTVMNPNQPLALEADLLR